MLAAQTNERKPAQSALAHACNVQHKHATTGRGACVEQRAHNLLVPRPSSASVKGSSELPAPPKFHSSVHARGSLSGAYHSHRDVARQLERLSPVDMLTDRSTSPLSGTLYRASALVLSRGEGHGHPHSTVLMTGADAGREEGTESERARKEGGWPRLLCTTR